MTTQLHLINIILIIIIIIIIIVIMQVTGPQWSDMSPLPDSTLNQVGARIAQSAVGYGLDSQGVRNPAETRFFSSPNRLSVPPSFYSKGTGVLFLEESERGVKLTTPIHLEKTIRMRGAIPLLPYTPSWRGQRLYPFFLLYFALRLVILHGKQAVADQ